MRYLVVLLLTLLLSACGTPPEVKYDYQGPNSGRVAIGIGATSKTNYSDYSLLFREIGRTEAKEFIYFQDPLISSQKRDYDDKTENGVVLFFRLPPGNYEIHNFRVFLNGGTIQQHFGSRTDFSIPFSIRANETTYLGNFQANRITGKNFFGLPISAGAIFVVTDRKETDLGILAKRMPGVNLGPVNNATPTPTAIGSPFFIGPGEKLPSLD